MFTSHQCFRMLLCVVSIFVFCLPLLAEGGSGTLVATGTYQGSSVQYFTHQISVTFTSSINEDTLNSILNTVHGTEYTRFSDVNSVIIQLPDSEDALTEIPLLQNHSSIQSAVPLCMGQPQSYTPNDTYWSREWYLHRLTSDTSEFPGINVLGAWGVTKGSSKVRIAILDSGIPIAPDGKGGTSASHQDLSGSRIVLTKNFASQVYAYRGTDTTLIDTFKHGTHVAGLAGATIDNNFGITGVAPICQLVICKLVAYDTSQQQFWWPSEAVANAVDYVVRMKNNDASYRYVINMSLGWPTVDGYLLHAFTAAYQNNITLVCAQGNGFTVYPAAFSGSFSNIIAVGALNKNGQHASYSTINSTINVSAPGGDGTDTTGMLFSDWPPNTFAYEEGTSGSSPLVAGVAALMLSAKPSLTPSQIRNIIQSTCTDIGAPGWDDSTGWGRVNATKALAKTIAPQLISPGNNSAVADPPRLTWHAGFEATSYELQMSLTSAFSSIAVDSVGITDTTKVIRHLSDTTYYWRIRSSIGDTVWSDWSDTMVFHVIPPLATQLLSPSDGGIVSNPPRVTWSRATGAASYRVQVSTSSNFSSTVFDSLGITDSTKVINGLPGATMYYWRVCYITTDSVWSSWSTSRSFKVTPPPATQMVWYHYTDGDHPDPKWHPITNWGTVRYKLYRSTGVNFTLKYTGADTSYLDTFFTIGDGDVAVYYYVKCFSTLDSVLSSPSDTMAFPTDLQQSKQIMRGNTLGNILPKKLSLGDNYPNPFNPTTTINFDVPQDQYVKIVVINTLGQTVATLVDGYETAGYKSVTFDANMLPSGVYFYRMQAATFSDMKKMLLLK